MWRHPNRAIFLRGLPRSAERGSLLRRFVGTPVEGRVAAKTGSITHVNTLVGYLERRDGRRVTFAIMANNHAVRWAPMLAQIDSLVVEIGKTR
jgi:D-alanyl-D-alanine carboxypeptidase/D-alanyl-D-alanine-endopeptidase (penicillin-binding protein 4)